MTCRVECHFLYPDFFGNSLQYSIGLLIAAYMKQYSPCS